MSRDHGPIRRWYDQDSKVLPQTPAKPHPAVAGAKRLLSEMEVTDELRLDEETLKVLKDMSRGKAPRGAAAILKAIEMRLKYSQPVPKVTVEHQGSVGIAVVDPYAEAPEYAEDPAALALPVGPTVSLPPAPPSTPAEAPQEPARARAPRVRKKGAPAVPVAPAGAQEPQDP